VTNNCFDSFAIVYLDACQAPMLTFFFKGGVSDRNSNY